MTHRRPSVHCSVLFAMSLSLALILGCPSKLFNFFFYSLLTILFNLFGLVVSLPHFSKEILTAYSISNCNLSDEAIKGKGHDFHGLVLWHPAHGCQEVTLLPKRFERREDQSAQVELAFGLLFFGELVDDVAHWLSLIYCRRYAAVRVGSSYSLNLASSSAMRAMSISIRLIISSMTGRALSACRAPASVRPRSRKQGFICAP